MTRESRTLPFAMAAAGLLVLAACAAFASRSLPEWRPLPPLSNTLAPEAAAAVKAAGGTLRLPRAKYAMAIRSGEGYERAFRLLGPAGADYLAATGGSVGRVVSGTLDVPGMGLGASDIGFDASGRLRGLEWTTSGSFFNIPTLSAQSREARDGFVAKVEEELRHGRPIARDSETSYLVNSAPVRVRPLAAAPGEPPEAIVRVEPPNAFSLYTSLADRETFRLKSTSRMFHRLLVSGTPHVLLALLVAVLFAVLLFRRRISARIGLTLGALALFSMLVGGIGPDSESGGVYAYAFTVAFRAVLLGYLVILWVVGESLLRETVPGFTTSLDALAYGRLGPRSGRALLFGFGIGATVAAERLFASALASRFAGGGLRPDAATFELPVFAGRSSPFFEGPYLAAIFVLFIALLRLAFSRRLAEILAAVLFALLVSIQVPLAPWGAAFASALAVAILLLVAFQRIGFAALLVATTSAALFRETFVAFQLGREEAIPFLVGAASLAVIATAGFLGAARPEREDEGKIDAPGYIRRLESERRVKYEMDLLSRMQLALLPEKPPEVAGLEIAVKTVLATEAGGDLYDFIQDDAGALWIAAGDVSGHGYSCGIQQAMVKASLVSLVKAGRRPGEILCEVDRVLRTGHTRLFTSLLLLRIEPTTGSALFANAGHPFPILLAEGRSRELVAPGLPLGQGPPRTYPDHTLELAPGAVFVLASDGLYEGPDRFDEPYGYDRPRAVLEGVGLFRRPASAILEALFADWRRHVGDGAPSDDTTVLVVKRPALFG